MSATTPAPAAPESTWSDRDTAAAIPDEVRDAVDAVLTPSDLARPEREILTTRIERWYPDVADGLTTLYGEPVATRTAANLLAALRHLQQDCDGLSATMPVDTLLHEAVWRWRH